ncbi:hypothetical protein HPB51_012311 [Rhipicephalus microplus]|uniref:Uncharacterized protein n=1 Tax=Rhipicephalus microplus TaxID=6941 RepID=A0A9J6D9U0_RHIMP|nr:hypothetical protein HPB51_012311 [Rhipicephalus microplus]
MRSRPKAKRDGGTAAAAPVARDLFGGGASKGRALAPSTCARALSQWPPGLRITWSAERPLSARTSTRLPNCELSCARRRPGPHPWPGSNGPKKGAAAPRCRRPVARQAATANATAPSGVPLIAAICSDDKWPTSVFCDASSLGGRPALATPACYRFSRLAAAASPAACELVCTP